MGVNQQLRAARKQKHWSQAQAADKCGVDLQTFFRWEHEGQEPRGYNLDRLCEVFCASMEELGYAHEDPVEEGVTLRSRDQESVVVRLTPQQIVTLLPLVGDSIVDDAKREILRKIFTTTAGVVATSFLNTEPWERLIVAKPATSINQETIQHFSSVLDTCRALSNGTEMQVAGALLDTFLPKLQAIAPYQSEVAGLAARGLQLKSILVAHNLHINDKILLCQAAIEQAKHSTNPTLIVTGLLQLGVAYHYAQQHDNAIKAQQEALYYVGQTSPLIQSHIYTELSATLAQFGRTREANFYISLAYETFPQHPEYDPNVAIDDHWFCNLGLYKGIMYTHLKQPKEAWEAFEEHKKIAPVPERIRLEILNHQGRTAIQLGDLEKYVKCLGDGLSGSVALRSKKRYNEAITIFQSVPAAWHKESQLQPLLEQYML